MVTVETDGDVVERRLVAGELSCPGCGGVLAGWGWARPRWLRGADGPVRLCPRRSRCIGCGVTHVLLPVTALLRRADAAGVIVSALAAKASRRVGFRRIAAGLARPAETVRGWLRRLTRQSYAYIWADKRLSSRGVWQRSEAPSVFFVVAARGG